MPVAASLIENIQKVSTDNLKQIQSNISNEMKGRKVPLRSPLKAHRYLTGTCLWGIFIVHSLIKEEALRTNIQKLSTFSGELAKGEVSFQQWCYELQTPKKTYSDSALREEIQRSLRGPAAGSVCNMDSDVSFDNIIKKYHHSWEC